jgi:transposase InsO family protein
MILHGSAALSHRQRERLVSLVLGAGLTITAAALIVGCSRQTASKWVGRARRGEGLHDRSSRPHRSPRRTPAALEQAVLRARRQLRLGPHPLGWELGLAPSTVHAILARHGQSRLRAGAPHEPSVRYERSRPGELVHIDVKPLGHIRRRRDPRSGRLLGKKGRSGRVFCFVGVDDCSRLAYARLYPDETTASATAFLDACRRFYRRQGITIERVLTDNGKCFKRAWDWACARRRIRPRRTRPRRPQTNGKVERLIRTLGEGWAYGFAYASEAERAAALGRFLAYYNCRRRHRALGGQTPLQRVNDLSGTNTRGSPTSEAGNLDARAKIPGPTTISETRCARSGTVPSASAWSTSRSASPWPHSGRTSPSGRCTASAGRRSSRSGGAPLTSATWRRTSS